MQEIVWMVGRRLVVLGFLLLVISFAVFALLYISPGSTIDILLGPRPRSPETVQLLKHQYHLDQPFFTQYWTWLKGAVQLHFGNSVQTTLPVIDEVRVRLPTSIFLGCYAFVLTTLFGVGGGVVAALRRRSVVDRGIVAAAIVGLSTPAFVSGVFLLYLFAVVLPWFPAYGLGTGVKGELWHLSLPALALALVNSAFVLKHTRAAVMSVLDEDYVVFARSQGMARREVLLGVVLRNALIPVVTISGLLLAFLITGAVLVEVTFSLPGLGQLLVQSATTKDVPMLQGVAIVVAVVIMVANLLADLIYMVVDPRIRPVAR